VSEKPVFSPDGKLAYMRGKDELTVPGQNGAPVTLHLRKILRFANLILPSVILPLFEIARVLLSLCVQHAANWHALKH
jgi:hypothetical protein